ncbi:aminoacetone oxidase family FAD-binding enzyme [Haploplasma axanthum]|uniref:Flavoprotein, HI0933 family n=1 Tax=Haploplasma axanthum TaxID=29552 RepID=A0A449BF24_HAPAX|nr:aminoacetone oxidase family FAD-binding enzyme [Haploplasma axanthum]VEU81047.1 flavoprotein, HI0933 family [Haploplasma axanthum]
MEKLIVIGGGPAGMMAAISAKMHHKNLEVVLIDRNEELGRKLRLTGGGRCNVTANVDDEEVIVNVPKNGKFLYSSLANFNPKDIIRFFEKNGCELKEEDHFRMFPISNKSSDIVDTLKRVIEKEKVKILFNTLVLEVTEKEIITSNGKYTYDYLIIATGGITLPNTGSDGKGHEFAKNLGHTITDFVPAEVPLVSNDDFIMSKELQGLSFKDVTLNIYNDKNKIKKSITHDLLITHFGISGPAALRASFEVLNLLEKQKEVIISIDFLPNNSKESLLKDKEVFYKILKDNNIPARLVKYIEDKSKTFEEIVNIFKSFLINIYTTRGFKSAFVTNGGVALKNVNPQTMKSKINNKISFCGEVLDINAYTGGFNITSALSTGYTAGKNIFN